MSDSAFKITNNNKPVLVKLDHSGLPCCGFDCFNGYVTIHHPSNEPLTPENAKLLCSNSTIGCVQRMFFAFGTTKCMECNILIAKVSTYCLLFRIFLIPIYCLLLRGNLLPKTGSGVMFTAAAL